MAIRRLERGDWTGFCLQASRGLLGKWADIEIASLQIGAQLGARHLPLIGISYDPQGDVLQLIVGELEHLIHAPRELYVDEEPLGLVVLQVVDAEGVRQIITLRDPLLLPGPSASRAY
jgi:hypothetical protein